MVTFRRLVHQLLENHLHLGRPFPSSVLIDRDGLPKRLFSHRGEVLRTSRAASGISGLTLLKSCMTRRLTVTDLVSAFPIVVLHLPPPPLPFDQTTGHSRREVRYREGKPATAEQSNRHKED